jgi:hypothetical protein
MFMHPSRKGAITEPTATSVPFLSYPDSVFFPDNDTFLPDCSQEIPFQYFPQEQPRLQSPFLYSQVVTNLSPPSSVPSSPTSSPASSVSHFSVTTAVATDYYPAVFDGASGFEAPSMTPAPSYNPSIHVQQADSPQPQAYLPQYQPQPFVFDGSPMLAQSYALNNHGWETNVQASSPAAHPHDNLARASRQFNAHTAHLQTPSSSASRSPGGSFQPRAVHSGASTKPLPTPVHTPAPNSFLTPQYQKSDLASHDGSQSSQFLPETQHQATDYPLAPSVSTVSRNSPVTPQTGVEDVEDASKSAPNGEDRFPADGRRLDDYLLFDVLPDYSASNSRNRTIDDAYQDELFNPTLMQMPQVPKHSTHPQNLLAPSYHNLITNRLQAANQGHMSARAQSPIGSMNRERSPFRQNSPLAAEYENEAFQHQPPVTSVPTGPSQVGMRSAAAEPKTISPKDAVLSDFNEGDDHGIPMFHQPDFNLGDTLALRQDSSFQPTSSFPPMESFSQFNQAPGASQPFHFSQPQPSQRPAQPQNSLLHQTPDFPASIPQFESTGSDVYSNGMASPSLAKSTGPGQHEITRPQDTAADSGTYTCTYHGCTQRFESPAKLQKHKREAHRQTTPGGHLVGRDGSSRNSQAGPHKCERINPSTGKPCNSIFSRPYDLTRHEDTIHNARKLKVRCHLCTEEKTFSRNDALTRHMRVVHPEIDWPGKQRRRGRE